MSAMAEIVHPLKRSVFRGLQGHCPACGKGPLFWRYLKVNGRCEACGHDLARYPADDGPAYLTILLVGHLIVAPLLFFPIVWRSPAALFPADHPDPAGGAHAAAPAAGQGRLDRA